MKSEVSDYICNIFLSVVCFVLIIMTSLMFSAFERFPGWSFDLSENELSVIIAIVGIVFPVFSSHLMSVPFDSINTDIYSKHRVQQALRVQEYLIWFIGIATLAFLRPYPNHVFDLISIEVSLYEISDATLLVILYLLLRNYWVLLKIKNAYLNQEV